MDDVNHQKIAVAVIEHEGRYLAGPRPLGVAFAGYWEFPGGKIGPGESAGDAAVRETLEETGLAVSVISEYPATTWRQPRLSLAIRFFACRVIDPSVPPRPPFRWIERSELLGLRFPPANLTLVEMLSR